MVKASTSRVKDPGFKSRWWQDFSLSRVIQVTWTLALQWLPYQVPGIIGSALGLVGPLSVYCDCVRLKVWSSASTSVWQHVKLSEQIRPWDTQAWTLSNQQTTTLKAVLNWTEHSVREQLCLLEMFRLAVWFLIDVFDLGEQLCSRPMGRRSYVQNVGSAGYESMLLIGWTLSWRRRRNKKEARL